MSGMLFLGVDGGGTNTRVRIRDASGALLGEGHAGAGNARLREAAFQEIMQACRKAAAAGGLEEGAFSRVHAGFGLAGTQQLPDRQSVLDRDWPFASIIVDTDAYASYMGAFGGDDGAIFILGTGSAGLACVQGERLNVGGWGADIGDDGSGMAIGRLAIRKSIWALEGMAPRTPLAERVLDEFGRSPPDIVMWAGTATPGDFARFAPWVFDAADAGDQLATDIIRSCAADAAMLIRRLLELGAPKVAMIGGIFPPMMKWLPAELRGHLIHPARDAMDGAIAMAQRGCDGIGTGRPGARKPSLAGT